MSIPVLQPEAVEMAVSTEPIIPMSSPSETMSQYNIAVAETLEKTVTAIKKYTEKIKTKLEKKSQSGQQQLSSDDYSDITLKIDKLIKYYNDLQEIYTNIFNEENLFCTEIKKRITDADITIQEDLKFNKYTVELSKLDIEDLLQLANRLIIYIDQTISYIESILSFNKKYSELIESIQPLLQNS